MQTQKTLVEMHPQKGILNIDVLSFERLAYRIFEEVGGDTRKVLEETGKNMILQKLVQVSQKKLVYLKNQMKKPGYLDEVKSLISEFMQYEVRKEELDKMIQDASDKPLLQMKLKDVAVLYEAFREYLSDHFMTAEEVLEVLAKEIPFSEKLKGSTVVLDGYTGFTPVQHTVIRELLQVCEHVTVTVTMDVREQLLAKGKPHELFYMSHKMIRSLSEFTRDMEEPIWVKAGAESRFAKAPALNFLEQNLFRYHRGDYNEEQKEVQIFQAGNPEREMEETARRISQLVREHGYRYGQIAVITVDDIHKINKELEAYNPDIAARPQLIAANKIDCIFDDGEENPIDRLKAEFEPKGIKVYPISAVTGQGLKELLYGIKELLDSVPAERIVFEQEFFPEYMLPVSDEPYSVTYDEDANEYVVEGPRIEKMLGYTNLDSEKGFTFFQNFLKDKTLLVSTPEAFFLFSVQKVCT